MLEIKWTIAILVLVLHIFLFIQMATSFIKLNKLISKLILAAKDKGILPVQSMKPLIRYELLAKEINTDEAALLFSGIQKQHPIFIKWFRGYIFLIFSFFIFIIWRQ